MELKTLTLNGTTYDSFAGAEGKDGTSVTVSSVSESTEDGGSNVVTFSDGNTLTVKNGKAGTNGKDGVSPTVAVSKTGKVTTLTITDANGTKTATINDGEDGASDGSAYTIPDYWQTEVDNVVNTVKSLQMGKNCITFPFFSDNHQRNGYAGMLIAEVMKRCNIPFCFYGGDSISNGYIASEAEMIAQDKAFDSIMSYIPNGRFCRTVGNHDGFWNVSSATGDEYHYTRDQVYELFMREESIAQNKHFGEDGTYYYVDDTASKVRWIVLNTNDNDSNGGASVDSTQLAWLQNTALKFTESGWAVVLISHQPLSNHYHSSISNATAVISAIQTYVDGTDENKADIVGCFSGHIHRDRIYTGIAVNTSDDSEGARLPFKQVTITSDHTSIAYDDATKHTVAEDALSHAIDFVTINRNTKTVNLTRLGIGNNRAYSYDNVILYSITNTLTNVANSNGTASVEAGQAYTATLTASSGYELSTVKVTMGGTDVTSSVYADGTIHIASVTGDIVITATATEIVVTPSYTNLIKFDADGNPTNVTLNQRLNSSGTTSSQDGSFVINDYIPANGVSPDKVYINRKPAGTSKITHYKDTSGTVGGRGNTSIATTTWTQEDDYYVVNAFDVVLDNGQYFKFSSQILTTALTNDDLRGLIVTHDEPIV